MLRANKIRYGLLTVAYRFLFIFLLTTGLLTDVYGEYDFDCNSTITEDEQPETPTALKNNFDKDFLEKDSISSSDTGFIDPLDMPAARSPFASRTLLNGIASAGDRLISAGVRGHIIYSDDKGKTWTQSSVPISCDLTAIDFPTPRKGWAVGHDGVVLYSEDGGESWVKQLDGYDACRTLYRYYRNHPLSANIANEDKESVRRDINYLIEDGPVHPFLDVWFEDESNGFIVGAFNLIFHTEDGGKNWIPWFDRTDNPTGMHLYAIQNVGKEVYICGEQGLVMKLDPHARHFDALKTPYIGPFFGISGNPGAVIAFGMRGNIYRSRDSGKTWEKVNSRITSSILGGTVKTDGSIILVTQGGEALVSRDNAISFSRIQRKTSIGIPAHAVAFSGKHTLVIAGWAGIEIEQLQ